MPSSPRTPGHSRRPSSIDISFTSPNSGRSHSRRQSKSSLRSPTTPNHRYSFNRSDSTGIDVFSSGAQAPSNGLGNLADELADAWDEEEEEDELDMNFQEIPKELETTRDSGVDVSEFSERKVSKPPNLTLPTNARHVKRAKTSDYDGSDYGEDSDMDSPGMPHGLVARMDAVESLARRGTENNGSDSDSVVKRVVEQLRDLGAQSGLEGGAQRLITAHAALSTHLVHQTRLLHTLTYSLFSPFSIPPDPEFIDDLLPLLITINEAMPRPTTAAFSSIAQLHALTADLVQTLNYVSDTLSMSRQTTTTAARRLKSAREAVAEMRKDEEAREEGERWLKRGNWGERLRARECAEVCGDVVGGFEEVCNGWRARLVAQAEAASA